MTHTSEPAGPDRHEIDQQVLECYRAQNAAMTSRDTERLDALLDERYVAVHIGGYRQPKREWLEQIRTGQMAYHSITEQSATVTANGDTAILDATALVDATIYGSRATWPLRSRTVFALTADGWKATSSEASTY
jgi:ketosteroid isomerase-like protein